MNATIKNYVTGFIISILLTLAPYFAYQEHVWSGHKVFSHEFLYIAIVVFAILQLFVQLFFFLHVGREQKPRWNLAALCFAGIVVFILVGGTLWIMNNLQHGSMDNLYQNGIITPQNEQD
jgi:cytochrome o ubiquinol oxidase operon protein cyoD